MPEVPQRALDTIEALGADPTAEEVLLATLQFETRDVATAAATLAAGASPGGGAAVSYAHIREEYASGVGPGGTPVAATWNKRLLNTEVQDADGIASLASNQITLAAGTYAVHAFGYSLGASGSKLRLRDITNNVTLVVGTNGYGDTAASVLNTLRGRFTLAGSAVLELQHYLTLGGNTYNWGPATGIGAGEVEVNSEIHIEKIA